MLRPPPQQQITEDMRTKTSPDDFRLSKTLAAEIMHRHACGSTNHAPDRHYRRLAGRYLALRCGQLHYSIPALATASGVSADVLRLALLGLAERQQAEPAAWEQLARLLAGHSSQVDYMCLTLKLALGEQQADVQHLVAELQHAHDAARPANWRPVLPTLPPRSQ